ncbi:hypothetical protein BKA67DRAFT_580381 [Truncatella angustata]|uniref:BZIP domain-containing protein n=1 Tax=Truncatella angustata TaxID=152316 RepID=A0A9P8UD39_9PEZI|nr:uncharacterized protein BKA67DRAFT_580381 [Truncatella angustata]KAH6646717.1 hypothetical protein BKA67DRAFT_580381 [Truncatella angustata]KAH8195360.1 hypothetical protein TruAng_010467 [Truncatella angustata]
MNHPSAITEPMVTLVPMFQQIEVRNSDDDWTGVTSAAERRKLQNRLNQRAYHKRKRQLRQARQAAEVSTADSTAITEPGGFVGDSDVVPQTCSIMSPGRQYLIQQFATQAYTSYLKGAPCLTHLPTLVRLNSFIAVNQNAEALSISTAWLDAEAVSPFGRAGTASGLAAMLPSCPNSLRPTPLQLAIEHHPWIDILPCPILRNNVLQAAEVLGLIDEDDLCHDVVEPGDGLGRSAFIVWGNPWDTSGWEVTPEFVRKWGGLLHGCQELLAATNTWREKRGERRLILEI